MHELLDTPIVRNDDPARAGRHRWLTAAAAGMLCGLLSQGCEPQLEIVVVRAPGFVGVVEHLKLQIVTEGATEPLEYGPFSSAAVLDEQFATVPPETLLYVDVMGCLGPARNQCDEDVEFIARGCSDWVTVARDGSGQRVQVEIDRGAVGAERCPPAPPTDNP